MEGLDEIISEFLVESYESLDRLDRDLLALEDAPEDRARLGSIFRTVHTIKGTSGFLALSKLEKVAHVGENLLVPLRDGELNLNNEIADGLLGMVDAIRSILSQVEASGTEGDEDYLELISRLEQLRHSPIAVPQVESAPDADEPVIADVPASPAKKASAPDSKNGESANASAAVNDQTSGSATASTAKKRRSPSSKTPSRNAPKKSSRKTTNTPAPSEVLTDPVALALPACDHANDPAVAAVLSEADTHRVPVPVNAPSVPQAMLPTADPAAAETGADRGPSLADSSVRIDVALLDKLMNLVGELVLSRNQILQFAQNSDDPAIAATSQRLNLITTELQAGVMKTRMQPIRNAWAKLPRVVRDLSNSCGKQVEVQMEGAETELDKTILEAIKDPLTHIVRNSVDHGIESPEVRVAAGKPEEGTLWLRAYHEGGQVNIEIADDGGGINLERVRNKAIEKGLITQEQAAAMSDREAVQLILLPGFSTAAKVTNVSGRGVGMDVVKTNVEKIGGTLEIQSVFGQGTTLRIRIPLTLAIIPALIVTTDGDRYAIPQVSLLELVRLEGEQAKKQIEYVHGAPVYRLRGKLLPLVYLSKALGTSGQRSAGHSEGQHSALNLDFMVARSRHLAWKGRLRNFLDGRETMNVDEAVSPKACSLGKWLYAEGLQQFGHLPKVHQLEKAHAEMHATVGKVFQKHSQGDMEAAEQLAKEVESLSHRTVALLDDLKETAEGTDAVNIVVLRANDRQYGLVVDKVNDSAEIVVKPLSRQLKGLSEYAGTTIMGDGTVALILDVMGVAVAAGLSAEHRDQIHTAGLRDTGRSSQGTQTLLVVDLGDSRRFALPTSMVARLEKVAVDTVELTDGHEVIQYRGEIMPIVRLANIFGGTDSGDPESSELQIIVYSEQDFSCGFAVNRIVDIVETELNLQKSEGRHNEYLLGTTVIQNRVTDVLNLCSLARN
ncbi:MAG: chemotaxis protein CheW [Planctomycetaceae bacterium]